KRQGPSRALPFFLDKERCPVTTNRKIGRSEHCLCCALVGLQEIGQLCDEEAAAKKSQESEVDTWS
ncbi:MAG: hypothetical protein KAJ60_04840, partial [Desulfobulbaceae bacterium]|nr:hypothetical protein [Desulfobulbaceae bacterium]